LIIQHSKLKIKWLFEDEPMPTQMQKSRLIKKNNRHLLRSEI